MPVITVGHCSATGKITELGIDCDGSSDVRPGANVMPAATRETIEIDVIGKHVSY